LGLAGVLLLFAGCDQWALFISSDGVLFVSIVSYGNTSGRFRVASRGPDGVSQVIDVPPSGSLNLSGVQPGEVELTLIPPYGCRVTSANPQTVTSQADKTVRVSFDVQCDGPAESLTGLNTKS
jgi:hypothetical protein